MNGRPSVFEWRAPAPPAAPAPPPAAEAAPAPAAPAAPQEKTEAQRAAADLLSPTQLQCVFLAGQGKSNKEIARDLGIAIATVNCHLRDANVRLGVHNRFAAALAVGAISVGDAQTLASSRERRKIDVGNKRGLLARILRWAKQNPDDDLTVEDACIKFGCSKRSLHTRMAEAKSDGLEIELVRIIRLRRGGGS